ncbi:GNAT family N-acetyltransferase [Stappia sp. GBMRC 2046]|uniref:GNAT family N-acetyltransferase n=1 Tax=Stappia sediminis TaxID=2692190 RepID=A0A7X3S8V8_9HYPH|nr:GNAT family N-acetyltransferase [Stappia sediminis]MXN66223.1 GNAT family N-acetyltransferase [Stappia sediminis]
MTIRNLEGLFAPSSIAVVGPNRLPNKAYRLLLSRLCSGDCAKPVTIVGCGKDVPDGLRAKRKLSDLDEAPDLMILAGDPQDAPRLVLEAGGRGTRAVIALSPGFAIWPDDLVTRTLEAAREHTVRLLGPGSLGVAAPRQGFFAHLAASDVARGDLALIARSGTVLNATLSHAASNRIGFSAVASLGQRTDIDVSDLLDWFALDYRTRAILVHLEGIGNPQKFLSAARIAASSKPVIAIRSGKSRDRRGQGTTHAGRLAAPDLVFEAALQRAGILRVDDLGELFDAAETVERLRPVAGRRLAIVSTGRSLATIAADQLTTRCGELAELSEETKTALASAVRSGMPADNPLILPEATSPETFREAVSALLAERQSDGVLALAAPSAFSSLEETAGAIAAAYNADKRPASRKKALIATLAAGTPLPRMPLDEAGVPCYASAADAVRSFMHLVQYTEAKTHLMAAPPSLPSDFKPNAEKARAIAAGALEQGRTWLDPAEVSAVLAAYEIPQIETLVTRDLDEVYENARTLLERNGRIAVKITSPQLPFKSDVGGVILEITTPQQAFSAAKGLIERISASHPDAEISGIVLQPMRSRPHGAEIFAGIADDPTFGPIILFGHGGTAIEIVGDIALELPPLDLNLAGALVNRTRVCKLLQGFRNRPKADFRAVALTLVKLSQIAADIPEIREMDVNPLLADADGVLALDARISVAEPAIHKGRQGKSRLAIAPYPKELEQTVKLKDGSPVFIRPVRPEDEELYREFFATVAPEDLRLRFFAPVREFTHAFLARLVQLDYSRAMAFAALDPESGEMLGAVRLHADPDHRTGEYAIIVRSSLKGRGLGWVLMERIINYARVDGIETIKGEVLKENTTMLDMCQALGFTIRTSPDDDAIAVVSLTISEAARQLSGGNRPA